MREFPAAPPTKPRAALKPGDDAINLLFIVAAPPTKPRAALKHFPDILDILGKSELHHPQSRVRH